MQPQDKRQLVHNEFATTAIRVKSQQLCRSAGFAVRDREDIEQDLWIHLLAQAEHFDPERGSLHTFIDRVLDNAAAMMVRGRKRDKQAAKNRTVSLDTVAADGSAEALPMSAQVDASDHLRRTCGTAHDEIAALDDREAYEQAVAAMPEELRDICRRVERNTIANVARDLGVAKRTVRKKLNEARAYFERAGFGDS